MNDALNSRAVQMAGGCAVALLAMCFAIFALNLFAPPRPLAELLPTSTPTRRPPPTITPVAYPPTPSLVLSDDFTTRNNFPRASDAKIPFGYENASYRIAPPLDPGFVTVWNQTFGGMDYLNLTLDARAAPAENSPPIEYGMTFWHAEDSDGVERYLAFTVNSKGSFRLRLYEPVTDTQGADIRYQWSNILPSTPSSDIYTDGTPNRLRVDVHPRRLLAYINDELVIDTDSKVISDLRLRRDFDGRVGMIALTQDAGAEAIFTQYDIYADVKRP
ncbi:MAG TPA: hypothetical protein VFD70_10615 [Anaerolineae bacterium]|nr:hypothetical protein [Anaerolineae bacterium]